MDINLRDVHILKAECFELDGFTIQLLLIRDKVDDVYNLLRVIGGEIQESASGLSYETYKNRYEEWCKFYQELK